MASARAAASPRSAVLAVSDDRCTAARPHGVCGSRLAAGHNPVAVSVVLLHRQLSASCTSTPAGADRCGMSGADMHQVTVSPTPAIVGLNAEGVTHSLHRAAGMACMGGCGAPAAWERDRHAASTLGR